MPFPFSPFPSPPSTPGPGAWKPPPPPQSTKPSFSAMRRAEATWHIGMESLSSGSSSEGPGYVQRDRNQLRRGSKMSTLCKCFRIVTKLHPKETNNPIQRKVPRNRSGFARLSLQGTTLCGWFGEFSRAGAISRMAPSIKKDSLCTPAGERVGSTSHTRPTSNTPVSPKNSSPGHPPLTQKGTTQQGQEPPASEVRHPGC